MTVKNSFKTNPVQFKESQQSKGILEDFDVKKVVRAGEIFIDGDRSGGLSGSSMVSAVIFGENATPPTASNYPIGTVYFQYTA